MAVASLPLGEVTELTAVIPSLVAALASVVGVVAIATHLWDRRAGLLAGLVLATSPPLFAFGHVALPDMMLGCWMLWALYWFVRASRAGWPRGPLAGFYLCVGLAVASKGPAGYAALAGAIVAVLGTEGARGLLRLRPALGLVILALCAIPWLVPYHLESGGQFEGAVLVGHYGSWYFRGTLVDRLVHSASALVSFFPWTPFLVAAPWSWRRAPDRGRRALTLWTVTLWVLLGASGTPRARYLVPLYPLFALLAAEFLARAAARGATRPLRVAAGVFCAGALAAAATVLSPPPWIFGAEGSALFPAARWEQALAVAIVMLGGLGACWLARRGAFDAMSISVASTIGAILLLTGVMYPARYERDNDVRPLAAAAAAHTSPGTAVIAHPDLRLSYDFYLRRPVVEVAPDAQMHALLADGRGRTLITRLDRWHGLAPYANPSWRVLLTHAVAGRAMIVVWSPPS